MFTRKRLPAGAGGGDMNKMSRVFLTPGMLCSLSQSLTSICRANLSMASQAGSIVNNVLRIVDGDEVLNFQ